MNQTPDTTPITDFILQSERNLRIAKAVHSEWEATREALAKDFCNRLGAEFTKKRPGWKFAYDGLLSDDWGSFEIWKSGWEDQYCIRIQAGGYGETMIYGIGRAEDSIGKRPFSSELLEAIKHRHPSARSKKWYEAQIKLQSPDPDWRTPEVLWKMKTNETFLQEVTLQLLEIAQLSEKRVDSLVAKYQGEKEK